MTCVVMASVVMANIVMAYVVMADIVMAYIVMASVVMANRVVACIVMAYIYSHGRDDGRRAWQATARSKALFRSQSTRRGSAPHANSTAALPVLPARICIGIADGMSIARVWAGTPNHRLGEAVIFSNGTPIPAQ